MPTMYSIILLGRRKYTALVLLLLSRGLLMGKAEQSSHMGRQDRERGLQWLEYANFQEACSKKE